MDTRDYTQQNAVAWNEIAVPRRGKSCPPEFFLDGKRTIDGDDLVATGDIAGKRILNLQCANAEDAISFVLMGASEVVAVDISDVALGIAADIAKRSKADVRFVHADVFDLPSELQASDFDLVWSRIGITCWLPDIDAWGRIVAAALKPGGRFVIEDGHPFAGTLTFVDDGVEVVDDYFGRGVPTTSTELGVIGCGAPSEEIHYLFAWPLGDIVTAVIKAGLRVESLEEFPMDEPPYFAKERPDIRVPNLVRRLPGSYRLVATKT